MAADESATARLHFWEALGRLGVEKEIVLAAYQRGSRVRGTATADSDFDLAIVVDTEQTWDEVLHDDTTDMDIQAIDLRTWRRLLRENCIWVLELIYAPPQCVWTERINFRDEVRLDLVQLRRSVCFVSGIQEGKSKRKMRAGDTYNGQKRLFISMMYFNYGTQMAARGAITDYGELNALWFEMKERNHQTWPELYGAYKDKRKELKHLFSAVAPYVAPPSLNGREFGVRVAPEVAAMVLDTQEEFPDCVLRTVGCIRKYGMAATLYHYGLTLSRHARHLGLVQLNYQQTRSPFAAPIARECAGIILDEKNGWQPVCWPYEKFFNLGEPLAAAVPWDGSRVYVKTDGSMTKLYHHDGEWLVASNGKVDASGRMAWKAEATHTTFEDLFWDIWKKVGYRLPEDTECCYMFEMATERHPHVVSYRGDALILHGARNMRSLEEQDPKVVAERCGWQCTEDVSARFSCMDDVVAAAALIDPRDGEGFVVCSSTRNSQGSFSRVKIKSPQHVAVSWTVCPGRAAQNEARLWDVIRANETSEFLLYCPEWRSALAELEDEFTMLANDIDAMFAPIKALSKGEFAERAKTTPYPDALYALHQSKTTSARDYLCTMRKKTFVALVKSARLRRLLPSKGDGVPEEGGQTREDMDGAPEEGAGDGPCDDNASREPSSGEDSDDAP